MTVAALILVNEVGGWLLLQHTATCCCVGVGARDRSYWATSRVACHHVCVMCTSAVHGCEATWPSEAGLLLSDASPGMGTAWPQLCWQLAVWCTVAVCMAGEEEVRCEKGHSVPAGLRPAGRCAAYHARCAQHCLDVCCRAEQAD